MQKLEPILLDDDPQNFSSSNKNGWLNFFRIILFVLLMCGYSLIKLYSEVILLDFILQSTKVTLQIWHYKLDADTKRRVIGFRINLNGGLTPNRVMNLRTKFKTKVHIIKTIYIVLLAGLLTYLKAICNRVNGLTIPCSNPKAA